MCIERLSGKYIPMCDVCNDTLDAEEDWQDAKDAMEAARWTRMLIDGVWMDVCTECQNADEE